MSSTPTSPVSPGRRRQSLRLSSFDPPQDVSQSPYTSGTTNGTTFSRRSSRTSQTSFHQSPMTPRPMSARSSRPPSFYDRRKSSSRLSIGSNISFGTTDGGMGNLADELEDALEDEYEGHNGSFSEYAREGSVEPSSLLTQSPSNIGSSRVRRISIEPQSPTAAQDSLRPSTARRSTMSKSEKRKSRHQKTVSDYDGSDYGPDSDLDDDGLTPSMAKRMGEIESLARMGINMEDALSEGGGVIVRTTHALKDLGPQASIESNLSRVIAAYTSMTTHRTHKIRDISSQAHSLLYGNILQLPEEVVDEVLRDLNILLDTVSMAQQQNPLLSLQLLASQTLDLAYTLRSLTDVLQESRIQANAASRKLKSVKDMVEDICVEQELVETSIMLIQAGDWDRRCRERQAAATCREVVQGFGDRWDLEMEERAWTRKPEVTTG